MARKNSATTLTLPKDLQEKLQDFAQQIEVIARDNLLAMYLYGSVTHKVFSNLNAQINLLIVLKNAKVENIENISQAVSKAKKAFNLEPTIITKEEVKTSADVFPIEFTDMKVKNTLIWGEDVFKNVQISMEDLRLACELELKKRLFHLRSFFVLNLKHPQILVEKLLQDFPEFMMQADTLFYIRSGYFANSTNELLKEIFKTFHIQNAKLKKVYEIYQNPAQAPTDLLEIVDLYNDYLSVVAKVAHFADSMEVYKQES
ncbi:MAG: hypothetical protein RMJ97_09035 [Raineya sp.]|nr:hypothetical protein [Raineya sp.]